MREEIIKLIPSAYTRAAVNAQNRKFSSAEMLSIVYWYSKSIEQRKRLFAMLSEKEPQAAGECMHTLEHALSFIADPPADILFELRIKENPQAYEERYLCCNLTAAREILRKFCQEYEVTLTEKASIWIDLRACLGMSLSKKALLYGIEDSVGRLDLNPDGSIAAAELWSDVPSRICNPDEIDFGICLDQITPVFIHSSQRYGLLVPSYSGSYTTYVIHLSASAVLSDMVFADHEHPGWAEIEPLHADSLPDMEKKLFEQIQKRVIEALKKENENA